MNSRNFKILVWLVIILLVINISALVTIIVLKPQIANSSKRDYLQKERIRCSHTHGEFMQQELGLSESQLQKFKAIRNVHIKEAKKIRSEIQATRSLQLSSLKNEMHNESYIDSLSNRIGELHKEWAYGSTQFFKEISKICTKEQRDKFFQLMENRPSHKHYYEDRHKGHHRKRH